MDFTKKELAVAELSSLRDELNATIDRINANENFCAGTVSAIFAFVLSLSITYISLILACASFLLVLLGRRRYYELRVHVHKIDSYLKELELKFDPDGGWTNHYYRSIRQSWTGGYSFTRHAFWLTLLAISSFGLGRVAYELFK